MKIYADFENTPKWILDYTERLVTLLGLEEWDLGIEMSISPGDTSGTMGLCQAFPEQNQCILTFRLDIKDNEEGHRYVLHEILHVWHSRIDSVIDRLMLPYMNTQPDVARDAYDLIYESFVAKLTDRLYPMIEAAMGVINAATD